MTDPALAPIIARLMRTTRLGVVEVLALMCHYADGHLAAATAADDTHEIARCAAAKARIDAEFHATFERELVASRAERVGLGKARR